MAINLHQSMAGAKQSTDYLSSGIRGMCPPNRSLHDSGFTFLELLVVITIILILLAFEIPNLLRAKAVANDAAAAASLRTMQAAEITYSVTYGNGFSPDLKSLGSQPGKSTSPSSAGLIDEILASGDKNGYTYSYMPGPVENGKINDYTMVAVPNDPCASGIQYYTITAFSPPTTVSQEISAGNQQIIDLFGSSSGGTGGCGQ